MTLRALRRQHAHALKMRRLTRMKGWDRAVTRLCRAIMERGCACKPLTLTPGGSVRAPDQFDVELPLPPSLNGAYANVAGVGRVKVSTYRNWQSAAVAMIRVGIPAAKRIAGPIAVSILLPSKMRGDCDNRIKPILDALVASGRIDDDRNVVKVSASKELQGKALALVSVRSHGVKVSA